MEPRDIIYEETLKKAIYNPKKLTKEERDLVINHKMTNKQVAEHIQEIHRFETVDAIMRTLEKNKIMVDLRMDGVYIRFAGKESKGEFFSLDWLKVYSFNSDKNVQECDANNLQSF